ncbi:MAG: adenylate kinase [Oscillospiraceae bacterium]|nr:adenylate kinase [Oscillospiraceae bacterium]
MLDASIPSLPIGRKILVLGCPGCGKSTFARKLQEKTKIPLIHLDNIWWKPDRTHITREEFDRQLDEILCGDAWIVDGYYHRTVERRLRACDTVVFLDLSEALCMQGITERIGTVRPDMPWTEEMLDPELADLVRKFHTESRPTLLDLLKHYPDKQLLRFSSRAEADTWLDRLPNAT